VQFVGERKEDPQFAQFDVTPHQSGILIDPISDSPLISPPALPKVGDM
jgi:hypothetical protein